MNEFMEALQDDGSLDPAILHAKRFSAHGIRFDNVYGEQCIGDAQNMAYMGVYVLMLPSQFLAVVPQDHIRSIDYMAGIEGPYGSPYLEISYPEDEDDVPFVREHEGRSRMSAILQKHGDVPVPVCLFLRMNRYLFRAREVEPEWIEKIARGVMREKEEGRPPLLVPGPVIEQAVYYGAGQELHRYDFRSERAAIPSR